jgi:hypothetical protein
MKMKKIVMVAVCLTACCATSGLAVGTAAAEPPEFGRCVEAPGKTGKYIGAHCIGMSATGKGRYEWMPGAGEKKKFSVSTGAILLHGTGASKLTITCEFAEGEGEYASAKAVAVNKLVLSDCKTPKKTESEPLLKTWCQGVGNFRGEITAQELTGELGYIVAKTQVGLDIKAKTGKTIALFECGGASEIGVERGTGTGTLMEFEGSVIGRIKKLNSMVEENVLTFKVNKEGVQVPEMFEGGEKDTLITNIGVSKTPEPTTLGTIAEVTNEEAIEVKAK